MRMTCPRRARPSRTSGEIRPSTVSTPGSYACGWNVHGNEREMTRGASIAACVFISKSTRLQTTWTIAWHCASSPGQPNGMRARPAFIRSAGFGVRRGRLFGAVADRRAALFGVGLLEQTADRHVHLLRIAEEALAVRGRELERFRVPVQELKRARTQSADVVALEKVQGHRHEWALRPRAAGVDIDTAIRGVHRRLDADALRAQVVFGDRAAGLAHECRDLASDVTLVDRVTSGLDRVRPAFLLVRALDRGEPPE